MAEKERLSDMLDALIKDQPEEAQIAFHDYLGNRMKEEIYGSREGDVEFNDED